MKAAFLCLALILLPPKDRMEAVTREVSLMGTRCTITVYAKDRMGSIAQIERLVRNLEDTEKNLSTWQDGSVLTALNHWPEGYPFAVEPKLCGLFQDLMYWTRETDGAFDPAIGALIDLWGIRTGGRFPSDEELRKAQRRSGMRNYRMDHANCRIIKTKDVQLDCGAFGKGEALDRLRSLDAQKDKSTWFVNLGGQVAVQGIPPGTVGWDVGIAHPGRRDESVLTIRMASGSLATSGGSERNLHMEKETISHILNPRTGRPLQFDGSVSVWHESALVADILSTALYVMGPEQGLAWAEARKLAACYLLASQSGVDVKASHAFNERFIYTRHPDVSGP